MEYSKQNTREFRYFQRNGKDAYYSFDEELYSITFPELWAQTHHPKTGPKNCNDCKNVGMWNGVFIGYCEGCALNIYRGMRGQGFICYGIEMDFLEVFGVESIYDTFLKDISIDDIGDPEIFDTRKIYYPTSVRGEIPTIEKYTDRSVDYISTPEDSSVDGEGEEKTKNQHGDGDLEGYDTDSSVDDRSRTSGYGFGYGYGSSYDGGYDSY
jgi:hypothetical protein